MAGTVTADLEAAHDAVVADIAALPDAALDWRPGGEEWPVRRIVGHLAHANDFYYRVAATCSTTSSGAGCTLAPVSRGRRWGYRLGAPGRSWPVCSPGRA